MALSVKQNIGSVTLDKRLRGETSGMIGDPQSDHYNSASGTCIGDEDAQLSWGPFCRLTAGSIKPWICSEDPDDSSRGWVWLQTDRITCWHQALALKWRRQHHLVSFGIWSHSINRDTNGLELRSTHPKSQSNSLQTPSIMPHFHTVLQFIASSLWIIHSPLIQSARDWAPTFWRDYSISAKSTKRKQGTHRSHSNVIARCVAVHHTNAQTWRQNQQHVGHSVHKWISSKVHGAGKFWLSFVERRKIHSETDTLHIFFLCTNTAVLSERDGDSFDSLGMCTVFLLLIQGTKHLKQLEFTGGPQTEAVVKTFWKEYPSHPICNDMRWISHTCALSIYPVVVLGPVEKLHWDIFWATISWNLFAAGNQLHPWMQNIQKSSHAACHRTAMNRTAKIVWIPLPVWCMHFKARSLSCKSLQILLRLVLILFGPVLASC